LTNPTLPTNYSEFCEHLHNKKRKKKKTKRSTKRRKATRHPSLVGFRRERGPSQKRVLYRILPTKKRCVGTEGMAFPLKLAVGEVVV